MNVVLVVRGGSWGGLPCYLSVNRSRLGFLPGYKNDFLGFRLVRPVSSPAESIAGNARLTRLAARVSLKGGWWKGLSAWLPCETSAVTPVDNRLPVLGFRLIRREAP